MLLQSPTRFTAHNPRTGEQVWSYEVACSAIPSPVADGDTVYIASGGLTALHYQPSAKAAEVVWSQNTLSPGNPSPVVYKGRVYSINGAGVLLCGDAATGEVRWKVRLKGQFWATPVVGWRPPLHFQSGRPGRGCTTGRDLRRDCLARRIWRTVFGTPVIAHGAILSPARPLMENRRTLSRCGFSS